MPTRKQAKKQAKRATAERPIAVSLHHFDDGQRVRIIDADAGALLGATGIVSRRRIQDDGAWIALDAKFAKIVAPLHMHSANGRVMLYPDQCAAV